MFDMCTTGDTAHMHQCVCVGQQLEYRIDVCRVTRGANIENL